MFLIKNIPKKNPNPKIHEIQNPNPYPKSDFFWKFKKDFLLNKVHYKSIS
jgi:hypothetical protein